MKKTDGILDCTRITSRPAVIQQDCFEADKRAEPYISAGEPCRCTPSVVEELKKRVAKSRSSTLVCAVILLVFAGVLLMCFLSKCVIVGVQGLISGEGFSCVWTGHFLSLTMPGLAVGLVLLSVILLRRRNMFLHAVEEAERGNVLCYSYRVRDILRYEYKDSDSDTVYEYYADLGGFAVKLAQKTQYSPVATGVVAQVGGKRWFFLLM